MLFLSLGINHWFRVKQNSSRLCVGQRISQIFKFRSGHPGTKGNDSADSFLFFFPFLFFIALIMNLFNGVLFGTILLFLASHVDAILPPGHRLYR